ncbi:MAG: hypothetical protein F9K40_10715 [Kofleriaceae bacterium]|nr:MAG: hypothetical protein F9K40_10715 [Kofleriaceae bacterium]MBZ0235491.1 IPT/TIG domain-containing protein [Kofleriaceae bacterium]
MKASLILALLLAVGACGGNDGKLKVYGLSPNIGDAMGGQYVVIRGQNFQKQARTAKVFFGNNQGNVVRFSGNNDNSELIVQAPGGTPGESVDVLVVFEPGGELPIIAKGFTYVDKKAVDVQDLSTKPKK